MFSNMGDTLGVKLKIGYYHNLQTPRILPTMGLTREQRIRQRLYWFQEARDLGSEKIACSRMGINRKTYYKWWSIYVESGYDKESLGGLLYGVFWVPSIYTTPRGA